MVETSGEDMNRPIADLWATYAERVLPADAGEIQTIETKRAFYAGAHGLFELSVHHNATETEDDAIAWMDAVQHDAEKFAEEVKEGKA